MRLRVELLLLTVLLAAPAACTAGEATAPIVDAIRTEATRPNRGPEGRPLPLASHWHKGHCSLARQAELIRRGHHLLPWMYFPKPWDKPAEAAQEFGPGLKQIAEWKLPVSLIGTQWEKWLYNERLRWRWLPPEENPLAWPVEPVKKSRVTEAWAKNKGLPAEVAELAVKNGRQTLPKVSPFGAVKPWREAGEYWTNSPAFGKLQELYPDPPMALLISNNEAKDLGWDEAEKSRRYMKKYGPGKSDEFKRKVVGDGWIERYRAMFSGMRDGLASDVWKKRVRIVGYNAFAPDHYGREAHWREWSLMAGNRLSPQWYSWDGASPEAYENHWEDGKASYKVFSCQVEMMNHHFMKELAWDVNPDFWYEVIFWDGDSSKAQMYRQDGLAYTPDRYKAWVQYVMWTLTPRVAREWRASTYGPENWWPYFMAVVRSVDLVHVDPVLRRFWRKGELVPNPDAEHPFNHDIPEQWKNKARWFGLTTSLDPPRPWKLSTSLPVLALARRIGEKPKREWLLYAHAPMGAKQKVQITIPDYRKVTVDVPVAGAFWLVKEADGSIVSAGDVDQLKYTSNAGPKAKDDSYRMSVNESLTAGPYRFAGLPNVLQNDWDDDGDRLTATLVKGPAHGELEFREDGTFDYKPEKDYRGTDEFTYRVSDGKASATAAVRIRVEGTLDEVVDDGDAGFDDVASFGTGQDPQAYGGDFAYVAADPKLLGGSTASWTFAGLSAGEYDMEACWPRYSFNRPGKVPMSIFDGKKLLEKVHLDQRQASGGPDRKEVVWYDLGRFKVGSGTLRVVLSNAADGRWVVADAVRVRPVGGGPARTIDNGDEGYAEDPHWIPEKVGFGGDCRHIRGDRGKEAESTLARWSIEGLKPGTYEVFATWPVEKDRARSTYKVFDGDKQQTAVTVNQSRSPRDLLSRGALWRSLGRVKISSGKLRVELPARVKKRKDNVTADAIGVMAVEPKSR